MEDYISSRQLLDVAIAMTVFEGLAITLYQRITGKGLAPKKFALNLISGLFLMLALRAALLSSGWVWIAASLFCAGLTHWADLWIRWHSITRRTY
jgi:hypothetical protein